MRRNSPQKSRQEQLRVRQIAPSLHPATMYMTGGCPLPGLGRWLHKCLPSTSTVPFRPLSVGIVGGGPAAVFLTWALLNQGHQVTMFERRPDCRYSPVDDARSFNITLDLLGLHAIGKDLASLIACFGTRVDGRAIYGPAADRSPRTHRYGFKAEHSLVAVPRVELLGVMYDLVDHHPRCTMHFDTEVSMNDADLRRIPETGVLHCVTKTKETMQATFDLVCFCDGHNGVGRRMLAASGSAPDHRTEEIGYLRLDITAAEARAMKMPLNKIAFFPRENGALVIALPNRDGTFSALVEDTFAKLYHRSPNQAVLRSPDEVDQYMRERLNMVLVKGVANISGQLQEKRLSEFSTCVTKHWTTGRVMFVGDAPLSAPPYAGFGTNFAAFQVALASHELRKDQRLDAALASYERNASRAAQAIIRIVDAHGTLLNNGMHKRTWWMKLKLSLWLMAATGRTPEYFKVAFTEGGLAKLVGIEDVGCM
jgi:2-polyprenyl-6-methoxyphenol hydroxylase-like FAD-dependent oxidoreductase